MRARTLFARWAIPAFAACMLFGVGDAAPAATDALGEADEADVFGDLDPRDRSGPRVARGFPAAGSHSHLIVPPKPIAPDPARSSPAGRKDGLGRGSRAPVRLVANLAGPRLPNAGLKHEAVPCPPSNPPVQRMVRTAGIPAEPIAIPGHSNFTQLTTGPPLAAVLHFSPAAARDVSGRPRFIAYSLISTASTFEPARLPAMPAVVPVAPPPAFESSQDQPCSTTTGSPNTVGESANPDRHLTCWSFVRPNVAILSAVIGVPAHITEAARTP